jgi:hypothetical protein
MATAMRAIRRGRFATAAVTLGVAGVVGLGLVAPAAYGAAQGPCYDGRCTLTVTKTTVFKVNGRLFAFGQLHLTPLGSGSVKASAITVYGSYISGTTSPGGTVWLNNLKIRVKSGSGKKVTLVLTPDS